MNPDHTMIVSSNRTVVARLLRILAAASFVLPALLAPVSTRAQGAAAAHPVVTTIAGVVYDSTAARPLAGASVQLASTDSAGRIWTVTTDSAGRYHIADVPAGAYLLGFLHSKLDTLRLEAPLSRVVVRSAEPVRANLATPSAETLFATLCARRMGKDSVGVFIGHVRDARSRTGVSAASVTVRWMELLIKSDGMYHERPTMEATTDESGWFAICGLPMATSLLVRAGAGADSSGSFEIEVPTTGLLARDVYVGRAERVLVFAGDSATLAASTDTLVEQVMRGAGRLQGRVTSALGRPASGARVAVRGTGLETRTAENGRFTLASLPAGTQMLDVRAVGFEPVRIPVDVLEEWSGSTAIELAALAIGLDTVRVTATRLYSSRSFSEYDQRKRRGLGYFIDGEALERRNPIVLTDLLRTVPGVYVFQTASAAGQRVRMRGGWAASPRAFCAPAVILDGMRITVDDMMPLNWLVTPQEVRAVEVYSRGGQIPAEFQSMTGCGAIVIWTGPRPPTVQAALAEKAAEEQKAKKEKTKQGKAAQKPSQQR